MDILRIWVARSLPTSWIVTNNSTGEAFIVPAIANGWEKRISYQGYRQYLEPVGGNNFAGLGVPFRRPWTEVCHGDGTN